LARKLVGEKGVPSTNLTWMLLKQNYAEDADSIVNLKNYEDNFSFQINKIAALNTMKKKYEWNKENEFLKDSLFSVGSYAFFYNLVNNKMYNADTAILKKLNEYSKYESNLQFYFELQFLKSLKLFYSGYTNLGINHLKGIAATSSASSIARYNKILGIWSMKMSAHEEAISYFDNASKNLMDAEAQLYKGMALLEAGYHKDAFEILNHLTQTPDKEVRLVAENLVSVLTIKDHKEVLAKDDITKTRFIHYRMSELNENSIEEILSTYTKKELKVLGIIELMEFQFRKNNIPGVQLIFSKYQVELQQSASHAYINGLINYEHLRLLEANKEWKSLLSKAQNLTLSDDKKHLKPYFMAVAYEGLGINKEAEDHFTKALQTASLDEIVYLKASDYYIRKNELNKAYESLIQGSTLLPTSVNIQKAYALVSLKQNLESYADATMENLKSMMNPSEYNEFKKIYEKEKQEAAFKFQQY
jgi:hypothetical protein